MKPANNNIQTVDSQQRAMTELATTHIRFAMQTRDNHGVGEAMFSDMKRALTCINKMPDMERRKACRSQWFKAFNHYRNRFVTQH